MSMAQRNVIREIVKSALCELSDLEYQQRVWVAGSNNEVSSMNEATAALFNDSGLDEALDRNEVTFTHEADAELRELRKDLRQKMADQEVVGTAAVIASPAWKFVLDRAARVLKLLGE